MRNVYARNDRAYAIALAIEAALRTGLSRVEAQRTLESAFRR
jgi:hypothetical protein